MKIPATEQFPCPAEQRPARAAVPSSFPANLNQGKTAAQWIPVFQYI